jgi:hypothetical protein
MVISLMGTNSTVDLPSAIAIPAKKPDRIWIAILLQPVGNISPIDFVTVSGPVVGSVVEREERHFGLSATFALATIMGYRSSPSG